MAYSDERINSTDLQAFVCLFVLFGGVHIYTHGTNCDPASQNHQKVALKEEIISFKMITQHNWTFLTHLNKRKKVPHMESYFILGKMLLKLGFYSSASMQTLFCSKLGQKQDLKLYRNYYEGIIR